jgi:hypothetical protein
LNKSRTPSSRQYDVSIRQLALGVFVIPRIRLRDYRLLSV